jgi:hypothetical protein
MSELSKNPKESLDIDIENLTTFNIFDGFILYEKIVGR